MVIECHQNLSICQFGHNPPLQKNFQNQFDDQVGVYLLNFVDKKQQRARHHQLHTGT